MCFSIERIFHGFERFIECNFYTTCQAVCTIMKERNSLDTKLLIFLMLLLRYIYLRADKCIRHGKREAALNH